MTRFWVLLVPGVLAAQARELELAAGPWAGAGGATTYELRALAPGFLSHGPVALAIIGAGARGFYGAGYDLALGRVRTGLGPYARASAVLGVSADSALERLAAVWTLGAGVEWRPLTALGVTLEARYQIEDGGPHGFWNPGPGGRGLGAALGVVIGFGRGAAPPIAPPAPGAVTGDAAAVVRTALAALGTPYEWGGTASEGFDCSGLVQYAYGTHGIRLPRLARDQAAVGLAVTPVVGALRPGDILLFSAEPGTGVTHVGLYAGEGKFIHSAAGGVQLSLLDPHDSAGAYWLERWVGARRVMP